MIYQGYTPNSPAELCQSLYEILAIIDFKSGCEENNDLIAYLLKILELFGYKLNSNELEQLKQFTQGIL